VTAIRDAPDHGRNYLPHFVVPLTSVLMVTRASHDDHRS